MKDLFISLRLGIFVRMPWQRLATNIPQYCLLSILLLPFAVNAQSEEVLLFSPEAQAMLSSGSGVIQLDESFLKKNSEVFQTLEGSFKKDGIQSWRGVPIERVLSLLKKSKETKMTFLAKNNYLCQDDIDSLKSSGAFLAFEVDGKPVKENRGGPVKLMFKKENIPGAYCWYVKAIFAGEPKNPVIVLETLGKRQIKTIEDLKKLPTVTESRVLPVPRGYRRDLVPPANKVKIAGILLRDLVQSESPGSTTKVKLHPLFGPDITLSEAEWRTPVLVIYEVEGKPIPVAFGGPVSVLFPADSPLDKKWKGSFFLESVTLIKSEVTE